MKKGRVAVGDHYESTNIKLNHAEEPDFSEISYRRPMGAYKPHFSSMPEDYYPTSFCDMVLLILFLLITALGSGGIVAGFMIWAFQIGNSHFVFIWSLVLIAFMILLFVLMYLGGKVKLSHQRAMIKQKLSEQKQQLKH